MLPDLQQCGIEASAKHVANCRHAVQFLGSNTKSGDNGNGSQVPLAA